MGACAAPSDRKRPLPQALSHGMGTGSGPQILTVGGLGFRGHSLIPVRGPCPPARLAGAQQTQGLDCSTQNRSRAEHPLELFERFDMCHRVSC